MNTLDESNLDRIFELTGSFMEVYNLEKSKLPYHINILDLIWANENAHSRIFAELLKQNSEKSFEILNSFLGNLTNFNQTIYKPEITSEKDRIDLLILDKDFALIIENKIHYAEDQPFQLAHYIEKVKRKRLHIENQIFVVYLTRDGRRKPEDQSWKTETGIDYKEIFSERFIALSYKEDILLWLKDHVLPNCRIKDIYLKSTVEQYIDHLEGMFNSRKINKGMNKELENHLIRALEMKSNPEENLSKIKTKIQDLDKVKDRLVKLEEKQYWSLWVHNLSIDFPSYECIDKSSDPKYPKVGVKYENKSLFFSILIESDGNTIYFGIGRHYASTEILDDVKRFVKPVLEGFGETGWYYGKKDTTYEEGYRKLKSLIEQVILLTK